MATPSSAPPVTFSTFVISLAHSALAHLGAGVEPSPGKADKELAGHTLELLDMLAEKTKGNLDTEEDRLLDAVRGEIRGRLGA